MSSTMPDEMKISSFSIMKTQIKMKIQTQRLVAKKTFLVNLFNIGIGTREIDSLARKVLVDQEQTNNSEQ